MDAVEADTTIHIMTERVRPLGPTVNNWSGKGKQEKEDWLVWGFHRISVRYCGLHCMLWPRLLTLNLTWSVAGGIGVRERLMWIHAWKCPC